MSEYTPHQNLFNIIAIFQKIKKILFYLIFFVSIIISLINFDFFGTYKILIRDISIALNLFFIPLFSIITIIVEYWMFPEASILKRSDFFDNSLGTNFIDGKSSINYYTNNEIPEGLYKLSVNLFENIFFSLMIGKKMLHKRLIPFMALSLILLLISFWGYKNIPFALQFLQLFLSAYFLGNIVRLFRYNLINKKLFEEIISLFDIPNFKTKFDDYKYKVLKIFTEYESNKASMHIIQDQQIFNSLNTTLSHEWINKKNKYKI